MNQNKPQKARTITEVLVQLDNIIDECISANNFLCLFAYVYRATTAEIQNAILNNRFDNPGRMERMDVIFANTYIDSYHQFLESGELSQSWGYAFEAQKMPLAYVQHILLGMNAHINLDLAIAAATVSRGSKIIDLKNDFMIVNRILAELTNSMQVGLGRVSIFMKLLDIFGFRNDEKIINFSIKKARDFSWLNAMELSLLDDQRQIARIREIDTRVLEISKIIKNPPGRLLSLGLKIISMFESGDLAKVMQKMGFRSKKIPVRQVEINYNRSTA